MKNPSTFCNDFLNGSPGYLHASVRFYLDDVVLVRCRAIDTEDASFERIFLARTLDLARDMHCDVAFGRSGCSLI